MILSLVHLGSSPFIGSVDAVNLSKCQTSNQDEILLACASF